MRLIAVAAVSLVLCHSATRPPASCTRERGMHAAAYLAVTEPAPADTMLTAIVCLSPAKVSADIGGYHGELLFDTLAAKLLSVQHPASGTRLENAAKAGVIGFAGVSTTSFPDGALLTARLRLSRAGHMPRLLLRITELNDLKGSSLLAGLRVDSLAGDQSPVGNVARAVGPDSCDRGIPHIRTISPAEIVISSGDLSPVDIAGCAFAATNILRVGPVTFNDVPSTENGTHIRFVVPLVMQATGEAPPRRMPTGRMDVVVTTTVASSNRLQLTLK